MKNSWFLVTCLVLSMNAFAQEDDYDIDENIYGDIVPKHSFTIELGLPVGITNKAFKSIMQGLVRFSPYYQFTLKNHLILTIG